MKIASEDERPTEVMIIPSTALNGLIEEEGSKKREGSFSENGRLTRMNTGATETKMTTKFRRVSSMTEKDPSEREVSSIRDDTSSEKEMPTRMERSASEGERPTELMIIPSTSFEDEGSKNRGGSLSEIRRSTRMKTSSTETKMTIKFRGVSSMTESCPSEVEDSNTRD